MQKNAPSRWTAPAIAALLILGACGGTDSDGVGNLAWMSGEVKEAWADGHKGQGTTITVVDEHVGSRFAGDLTGERQLRTHGSWTALQSSLVAPNAAIVKVDYYGASGSPVGLRAGLNVINNSYSVNLPPGTPLNSLDRLERSTIAHASNGTAVVVKAAGNESSAIGHIESNGTTDVFGQYLVGTDSAIFVGALTSNGTATNRARLAGYSNFAGSNAQVQAQFLVVGVDEGKTGLAGTSFAAPIVSGYAAILGSKFTTATPKQITDQLLGTARTDTIRGYSLSIHGQGEASLKRALAPSSLR